MALFGGNANQQSTTQGVPPELQPYYDTQSAAGVRRRRAIALIVPLFAILLIIVAVGAGLWWRTQHVSTNQQNLGTNQLTQQSTPKSQQSPGVSSGQSNNRPVPTPAQSPTPTPAPSPQTAQPSPTPNPTSTTIPNTGPGTDVVFVAIGAGVFGVIASYARRLRANR